MKPELKQQLLEALKLAYKAFEDCDDWVNGEKIQPAIAALEANIAKPEPVGPVASVVAIRSIEFFATVQYTPLQNGHPPFEINAPLYTTQQEPAAIPEGWKLVPVEPTTDMLEALWSFHESPDGSYKAMLAAAPGGAA